jgi:hypothetical protein
VLRIEATIDPDVAGLAGLGHADRLRDADPGRNRQQPPDSSTRPALDPRRRAEGEHAREGKEKGSHAGII